MLLGRYFVVIALKLMTSQRLRLISVGDGVIPRYIDSIETNLHLAIILLFF